MNIERMRKVRDRIADPKRKFDMSLWGYCIAGHAFDMALEEEGMPFADSSIHVVLTRVEMALTYLDLPPKVGNRLFSYAQATRSTAIGLMDELITEELARLAAEAPSSQEAREEELCLV